MNIPTIPRFLPIAALVLLGAACSDDASGPGKSASVRVVHASPDAPAVDVLVDGTQVLDGVPYAAASGYLKVTPGTRSIRVEPVGSNTAVIDADLPLAEGEERTVIAANLVASIEPLVLADTNTAPAAGNIRLRLVHGAPAAGSVDIYITAPGADLTAATPDFSAVPFKALTPYVEVPAGSYQVRITPTGSKAPALDTGTLVLAAGAVRTAIARDAAGGGTPLGVILLEDRNP